MSYKIVSDSSSNVLTMEGADYTTVPMKVIAEKEYVDELGLTPNEEMTTLGNRAAYSLQEISEEERQSMLQMLKQLKKKK